MNREEIINLITEDQKKQILNLEGIGSDQHFLGGPQLAGVTRNGENIGWGVGNYKGVPVLQTSTDLENWKKIISKYNPDIFIEMGTANGGNILYINDIVKELNGKDCIFLGVDAEDHIHPDVSKINNFTFLKEDTLSEIVFKEIKNLIEKYPNYKVIIHFDDCHKSDHVYKELNMYCPLIKKDDIIIVGDTWDEGWYESPFQSLCSFMGDNNDMYIDVELNEKMVMPCNWIFGILLKK
jgi:cephalosporin hydroxylase